MSGPFVAVDQGAGALGRCLPVAAGGVEPFGNNGISVMFVKSTYDSLCHALHS